MLIEGVVVVREAVLVDDFGILIEIEGTLGDMEGMLDGTVGGIINIDERMGGTLIDTIGGIDPTLKLTLTIGGGPVRVVGAEVAPIGSPGITTLTSTPMSGGPEVVPPLMSPTPTLTSPSGELMSINGLVFIVVAGGGIVRGPDVVVLLALEPVGTISPPSKLFTNEATLLIIGEIAVEEGNSPLTMPLTSPPTLISGWFPEMDAEVRSVVGGLLVVEPAPPDCEGIEIPSVPGIRTLVNKSILTLTRGFEVKERRPPKFTSTVTPERSPIFTSTRGFPSAPVCCDPPGDVLVVLVDTGGDGMSPPGPLTLISIIGGSPIPPIVGVETETEVPDAIAVGVETIVVLILLGVERGDRPIEGRRG